MAQSTPIVIERTVNAPVERVWQAISDPAEMKKWYFDVPEFRPVVGTSFQFKAGPPDKEYLHRCEVKDVEPMQRLAYSWCYDGLPGDSLVTFELTPDGDKTNVRLTHTGVESFAPSNDPNVKRESFLAGWTDIVTRMLPNFVEKQL